MADAGDYECRLLADLLPTCLAVADFFAGSDDTIAVEARAGTDAFTFHQNLYYEFCRLQAGQIVAHDGSLTVLGVGVTPLLEVLESRTPRPSLRPTWIRKSAFEGLEALRSKTREQKLSIEILRQRLRLSPSSSKSRKHIIKCLSNCNPEPPLPLEPVRGDESGIFHSRASSSPLARVSRLATRSHQLLCENWACTCVPPGSHIAARLLLAVYRSNKMTNTMRLELLLSTSDKSCPWQETEIDIFADSATLTANDAPFNEKECGRTRVDESSVQSHKVRFSVEEPEPIGASPKAKRWKVENICKHVHSTLGTRFRLLVEGNLMWRLRPARPRIKDLKSVAHISLSELIRNGYFLRRASQKDRFLLSYIIASAILSLYQGPWLDRAWTKDQIFFLTQAGDLSTPDLRKPLLSTKCIAVDDNDSQAQPDNIHPEPRIAALGIIMLEIALGMAIESRRDDGPVNPNTDLLNAFELVDQMQLDGNTIPKHVLAIKTCLQPEDIYEDDLSNEMKQQCLYTNIVAPLEAILTAYSIKTEDLDSTLGGDQELPSPAPRAALNRRNSSTTSIQSVGSANSIDIKPSLAEVSSVDALRFSDSLPAEKWFEDLRNFVFPLIPVEPRWKTRIAILDSGIDLPLEVRYACEDRLTYRSWIEGDDTSGTDTIGHGTHAAGLLLNVSPHAEIFVARITQKGELNPNIIAEAIKYATDRWKVDIITMSFGFPELDPVIDVALAHAAERNTILLAAASNYGNRHSIAWPARADRVICIHSLHGNGDRSSYTPNSRPQDYGILGQAVSSYWPPHLNAGMSVLRSGTSCAAPIAAGVAAIVLEYAQQKLPLYARAGSEVDEHVIPLLRSNAGIRKIFGLMSETRDGQNCIVPWSLLSCQRRENTMCDIILEKLREM